MSEVAEKFRKAMITMMRSQKTIACDGAVCKSVSGQTCTIIMDELEVDGILLGIDKQGAIIYPSVNANVLVLFSDDTKTNGLVVFADKVDKVELMGNVNGGLIKIDDLKTQFDAAIAAIKSATVAGFTAVDSALNALAPGSGVSTAAYNSSATSIPNLDKSTLENTKILHGNG